MVGLRRINSKYLDYLNQSLLAPSPHAMFPYYTRPLPHNIFSMPSARTSYPGRDAIPLPLASNYPHWGDMLQAPTLPGTNFPINDVVPLSILYGKEGFKASLRTLGYSPTELCVIAHYDNIEVVATKVDPLSGNVVKETRQIISVPFPLVEYGLQTGVELDGTISVFVPWRSV